MSAIVQLSYNINEKLRLDDHTFPGFEGHSAESQNRTSSSKSTSFSKSESSEHWPTVTTCTSSVVNASTEARSTGTHGPIAGQSCPKFDHQRVLSIHRCEIPPITLPKASSKAEETTVYKLRDSNSQKKMFNFCQQDKVHLSKSSVDFNVHCTHSPEPTTEAFPSIIGRSCTLHPSKEQVVTGTNFSAITDVPPVKKHCRSVSELDGYGVSSELSPWKPVVQSRVWVPIQRLNTSNKSFSSCSSRFANNCSRSLDYGSLCSRECWFGSSHLTPPASPIPRPASVTVIKQESGAWTFLSSQKVLPERDQGAMFSPLPSAFASPLSRFHDTGSKSLPHNGLAATKRSLSFSADFEHRKSIEYTPASTPELSKRLDHDAKRGGLSRCQSHPSGLNMKRAKCRRRSRLCSNRPTLDFAKMKQTAISKRGQTDDLNRSSNRNGANLPPDIGQILSITPVFPPLVTTDNSLKKNKPKPFGPVRSASPINVPVSFSIGCSKPLSGIQHRIPSPTDEVPVETGDEAEGADGADGFASECPGLNVDDIENDTDD